MCVGSLWAQESYDFLFGSHKKRDSDAYVCEQMASVVSDAHSHCLQDQRSYQRSYWISADPNGVCSETSGDRHWQPSHNLRRYQVVEARVTYRCKNREMKEACISRPHVRLYGTMLPYDAENREHSINWTILTLNGYVSVSDSERPHSPQAHQR